MLRLRDHDWAAMQVRDTVSDVVDALGASEIPALVVLPGDGGEPVRFKGDAFLRTPAAAHACGQLLSMSG
jgi:hypothetical protein